MFSSCNSLQELHIESWPLNNVTQTAISSLPAGDDAKNIVYATVYFTVPRGWTLINPLEIARYTTNAIGVRPTFNDEFTAYDVNEVDNGNGTYTIRIATDSLDNMPTTIYFREVTELLTVEKIAIPGLTNIDQMIESCPNVTYINVSDLDVSQVTSMQRSLRNCRNLTTINVTGWDTRNVTNLYGTFGNNPNLETIIGLEDWNVENVENFREICTGNSALQTFNIGNWRNNKNTTTYGMFYNCRALTELDMGGFDMGSLTSTTHMFTDATGLTRFNSPTNIRMSIGFNSTRLDLESVLDIIDNLATVTTNQTLTLGNLADQLTEEQIAVVINKGWTLS
jgi:surface protein